MPTNNLTFFFLQDSGLFPAGGACAVMTNLFCRKKVCITDQIQATFSQTTDQIQTASPENTDQNLKCYSAKHKTERRDTVLNTIVQGVYFDIITVESNSIYQTFLNLHKRV